MLDKYALEYVDELVKVAKKQGLRVFRANNGTGTWGLVTNKDGSKCISFGAASFGGLYIDTCHVSKPGFKEGSGIRLWDEKFSFNDIDFKVLLNTQHETSTRRPATLTDELTNYESSKYKEV